jgi:CRP/FNR family transcriptional regulator, polysaccharide utilization system transcription regulator
MNSDSHRVSRSCTVSHEHGDCFDRLTDEQRKLVEQRQVMVEFKKGENIARQGAFTTHVIYLREGLGKVYFERNNERIVLRVAAPGSLIGLTSLGQTQNIFQYSVSAYVNSVANLIDIRLFRQLIEQNGRFAAAIVDILSETAIQKNERFFGLTHRQSYGKLADLLLCLSGNIFKDKRFRLPLSRKDLAELAGMSTESVIRTIRRFEEDGLIKTSDKTFEIIDMEGLMDICQHG